MNWLLAAQIPLVVLGLWFFTAYMTQTFPTLRGRRICLLIAHPDDEAMFFAPTVLHLTRPELQNRLFILCLSSGDAEGLGAIRRKELIRSAAILGVGHSPSSTTEPSASGEELPPAQVEKYVVALDDPRFPDSMTATWDPKLIASILTQYFVLTPSSRSSTSTSSSSSKSKSTSSSSSSQPPPETKIDALITFDRLGVSAHPNHISLYHGARSFIQSLTHRHPGWESPVQMYTLTSVPVIRKYTGVVDAVATMLALLGRPKSKNPASPSPMVVVSTPWMVRRAQRAMTQAHVSQMRWFRWAWIGISRYMYMNDLSREKM